MVFGTHSEPHMGGDVTDQAFSQDCCLPAARQVPFSLLYFYCSYNQYHRISRLIIDL